ncbi:hypothetical protein BCV70DRAFT_215235 [Testicularia cyperi]|uniref:Nucleotide-diphospho-sugar transferase n=1 Tax=Testicularia cyperi TaxID=1882483 RepID=A0A317XU34_9BASI|nr:hypothetical protein BCV70DRAFT_215235 [Testicularia cyperi]
MTDDKSHKSQYDIVDEDSAAEVEMEMEEAEAFLWQNKSGAVKNQRQVPRWLKRIDSSSWSGRFGSSDWLKRVESSFKLQYIALGCLAVAASSLLAIAITIISRAGGQTVQQQHEALALELVSGEHSWMPPYIGVQNLTLPASHGSKPVRRIGRVMARFGTGAIQYTKTQDTGSMTQKDILEHRHVEYCRKWGYPLLLVRTDLFHGAATKLAAMQSVITVELSKPKEQRLEWLMWSDLDTLITNPNIELEHFLPPSPQFDHIHFMFAADFNGFNSGVFMVRVSQHVSEYFANSLAIGSYRHGPDVDYYAYEQDSMSATMFSGESKFKKSYAEVPRSSFNTYPEDYQNGDFILHFAGGRKTQYSKWINDTKDHDPERELSWDHTRGSRDMKLFWEKLAKLPGKYSVPGKSS